MMFFHWQVNCVNCNTSWKISLFLAYEDNSEEVLKGVSLISVLVFFRGRFAGVNVTKNIHFFKFRRSILSLIC